MKPQPFSINYEKLRLVGEALAPFRNQVVIATKFGWKPAPGDEVRWTLLDSPAVSTDIRHFLARVAVTGVSGSL